LPADDHDTILLSFSAKLAVPELALFPKASLLLQTLTAKKSFGKADGDVHGNVGSFPP
jgi:hypothetical protein